MHISPHRTETWSDCTFRATASEQTIKAAQGAERSSLTPQEIRAIVLEILG